jgi:hypothetical protein
MPFCWNIRPLPRWCGIFSGGSETVSLPENKKPAAEFRDNRLFRKLRHGVGKAIADFGLIEEGDRIAVAVSGGKDSYTLLLLLEDLRRRAPVSFELVAVNIDSGYPGYRTDIIEGFFREHGFEYRMVPSEHFDIIREKRRPGSSYCSICSRLKRGALYGTAQELGCNKLALGHAGRQRRNYRDKAPCLSCRRGYHHVFAPGGAAGSLLLLPGLRHRRHAAQEDEAVSKRVADRYSQCQEQPAESHFKRSPTPSA